MPAGSRRRSEAHPGPHMPEDVVSAQTTEAARLGRLVHLSVRVLCLRYLCKMRTSAG